MYVIYSSIAPLCSSLLFSGGARKDGPTILFLTPVMRTAISSFCSLSRLISSLRVPWLLLGVNVPDDVVWQADDLITGSLGHLCKTLGLCLVLECVAWEVDALDLISMNFSTLFM